jgi:hypothetical protein
MASLLLDFFFATLPQWRLPYGRERFASRRVGGRGPSAKNAEMALPYGRLLILSSAFLSFPYGSRSGVANLLIHKGTKAQRHKGTKAQRHKGTKAQRHKGKRFCSRTGRKKNATYGRRRKKNATYGRRRKKKCDLRVLRCSPVGRPLRLHFFSYGCSPVG